MGATSLLRRVDVDAADDLIAGRAEHGIGESRAFREVVRRAAPGRRGSPQASWASATRCPASRASPGCGPCSMSRRRSPTRCARDRAAAAGSRARRARWAERTDGPRRVSPRRHRATRLPSLLVPVQHAHGTERVPAAGLALAVVHLEGVAPAWMFWRGQRPVRIALALHDRDRLATRSSADRAGIAQVVERRAGCRSGTRCGNENCEPARGRSPRRSTSGGTADARAGTPRRGGGPPPPRPSRRSPARARAGPRGR